MHAHPHRLAALIPAVKEHLLSTYSMLGTLRGAGNPVTRKTQWTPCSPSFWKEIIVSE